MSRTMILLVGVLTTSCAAGMSADERLLIDFEQGDCLATYKRLKGVTPDAVVVAGRPDADGALCEDRDYADGYTTCDARIGKAQKYSVPQRIGCKIVDTSQTI
ncbi:MAG: hypothetical protein ISR77_24775 [Pirellulaceae bacterium]|nr:hypothetical protein [Pirellulaceae bacterium]